MDGRNNQRSFAFAQDDRLCKTFVHGWVVPGLAFRPSPSIRMTGSFEDWRFTETPYN
jgi:hypothetical protein